MENKKLNIYHLEKLIHEWKQKQKKDQNFAILINRKKFDELMHDPKSIEYVTRPLESSDEQLWYHTYKGVIPLLIDREVDSLEFKIIPK